MRARICLLRWTPSTSLAYKLRQMYTTIIPVSSSVVPTCAFIYHGVGNEGYYAAIEQFPNQCPGANYLYPMISQGPESQPQMVYVQQTPSNIPIAEDRHAERSNQCCLKCCSLYVISHSEMPSMASAPSVRAVISLLGWS